MNTPSNELFTIIQSLTSQEKRLFKRYCQQSSQSPVYLKLFDGIDSLKEYDEKRLIFFLNKSGGIKNLTRIKNYLSEALLNFFEYYYADSSEEIKLQKLIHRVEVLFSKRLFITAAKIINKAEKIAVDNHCFLAMLSVLTWQQKIMRGQEYDIKIVTEHHQNKYLKELHYMELYRNEVEYRKLKTETIRHFAIHIRSQRNLDKTVRMELNEILKNPFLKSEKQALSIPAKYTYWYILALIHYLLNNLKKSHLYFKRTVNYFDLAKIAPGEKLIVLSRFALLLSDIKKGDELKMLVAIANKIMNSLPKKEQTDLLHSLYLTLMNNYIDHQLQEFNLQDAQTASDSLLSTVEALTSPKGFGVYYTNRFLINFLQADYRNALRCANKVLSVEKKGDRQDIVFIMIFLNLLVHYELGNEEILERSAKLYIREYAEELKNCKTEYILMDFFGKTIHENRSKEKRKKAFIAFKNELIACKNKNDFTHFDFVSWAESKIENRPLLDILKEKI